jgi:hypothetical protein
MIGNTLAHGQYAHRYLVVSRIACSFLVAALVAALVGSLTISAPALEPAAFARNI